MHKEDEAMATMTDKEIEEARTKTRTPMTKGARVRPLGDNVLVRVLPKPEKSAAGLWLPKSRSGRETYGEIVRIGARVSRSRPSFAEEGSPWLLTHVAPGDVVRFDPYRVRLVIDEATGYDATGSAHAKGGQYALIPEEAILWVEDDEATICDLMFGTRASR